MTSEATGDVYVLSKPPGWNVSVAWDEATLPEARRSVLKGENYGKHGWGDGLNG